MTVLGIDPGTEQSAYVLYDGTRVLQSGMVPNDVGRFTIARLAGVADGVVFEQIESYGMAVGREVFETVFWTGRFYEAASAHHLADRMTRKTVKVHLCGFARAQDSNVRMALLDRFGGKTVGIGTKAQPGPLYGIKSHLWAALALAVTWYDLHAVAAPEARR